MKDGDTLPKTFRMGLIVPMLEGAAGHGRRGEYAQLMTDVLTAAHRWARTWERARPDRAVDDIAELYRPDAVYRSSALGPPEPGGAVAFLRRQFALEEDVQVRFGSPIAGGERAAVEWWASWIEAGQAVTLAGTSVLRFAPDGLVVDHVDYSLHAEGRHAPYAGWGS